MGAGRAGPGGGRRGGIGPESERRRRTLSDHDPAGRHPAELVEAHRDLIRARCRRAGWSGRAEEVAETCVVALDRALGRHRGGSAPADEGLAVEVVGRVLDDMDRTRCEQLRESVQEHRPAVYRRLARAGCGRDVDDVLAAALGQAWESMPRWEAADYD
ncbi:MAG: hypothetical protein LBK95_11415, partial [Bifidobacteriaceae bacterium]|nr:hypothetical protein [Bifidobacteriaceae bacterium]